jgi:AraC-like DNA-binding protein
VLPPAEKDLIVTFLASAISPTETPWGPLRRDRSEGSQTVRRPLAPAAAIHRERHWRDRLREDRPVDSLVVGRWTHDSEGGQDWLAPADPTHFVIEIALRGAQAEIFSAASPLRPGRLSAGQVHIVAAGQEGRGVFRGPCDLLHLFVPAGLAGTLCDGVDGRDALNRLAGGPPWTDPEVERLALALARAVQGPGNGPAGAAGLVRWRLKRVADYVDANFAEPLRLADLARCAGLSRMHFAAQFRAATGLRPHEYVLRHRIERARELLRDPSVPLVEVALSVGFQTQAHFSTVFRQLVGETPGRWRQSQCQDRETSPCRS